MARHFSSARSRFAERAYLQPFPLETSRYALVAKALHCETTFSTFSEIDISCDVENQRIEHKCRTNGAAFVLGTFVLCRTCVFELCATHQGAYVHKKNARDFKIAFVFFVGVPRLLTSWCR